MNSEFYNNIRKPGVVIFEDDKQKETSPGFSCSQSRPFARLTEWKF